MNSGIIDVAGYLPPGVLTNEKLTQGLGKWTPKEIHDKIGIDRRHVANSDQYTSDLAVAASEELLARHPAALREKIDLLIICTQTPDYTLPTTACLVQHRLQLGTGVAAFDVNLGCSGFVYALSVARSMIATGDVKLALICCADTYCKWIGNQDTVTRPIFGDGAAAILVGRLKEEVPGIGRFVFGTDGSGWDKLIVRNSGGHAALNAPEGRGEDRHLYMNGPEIFRFTTVAVKSAIASLLTQLHIGKDAFRWFILHQASGFILKHLIQNCELEAERTPILLQNTGNTVSASIPLVLASLLESQKLQPGDRLVLVGFGVGYSWACCDVVWQPSCDFEVFDENCSLP